MSSPRTRTRCLVALTLSPRRKPSALRAVANGPMSLCASIPRRLCYHALITRIILILTRRAGARRVGAGVLAAAVTLGGVALAGCGGAGGGGGRGGGAGRGG